MPSYLVETYLSRAADPNAAATRAKGAGEAVALEGADVRYVRSTFIAEEETCFHLFEAASSEAVRRAFDRAELPYMRIVEAVEPAGSVNDERRRHHAEENSGGARRPLGGRG